MRPVPNIKGSVLPTVLIISVVMMLVILSILSLWDFNHRRFARMDYFRKQSAAIESFYTLYKSYPYEVAAQIGPDSLFHIFDGKSQPIKVEIRPWGLYELVMASSLCGRIKHSRFLGLERPYESDVVLWYRNGGSALTVTGRTEVTGNAMLPDNGLIYGQMQSVFFSGTEVPKHCISASQPELPGPDAASSALVEELFALHGSISPGDTPENIHKHFPGEEPAQIYLSGELPYQCRYEGNVVVCGDRVTLRPDCELKDILLVANTVEIEEGFEGRLQIFVRDSIGVGDGVMLGFPSGIYSANKLTISEKCVIDGYVIDNFRGGTVITEPNTVKSVTSRIRGLLYSRGLAVAQGIITGSAYINEAVYYAPHGYYRNFIFQAAFLAHEPMAYPLWMKRDGRRKEVAWLD